MKSNRSVTNSALSRRDFLQLSAGMGVMLGLGRLSHAAAATLPTDYKALVCVFLFGGNDGHNTIVPLGASQYPAYAAARGALALPMNQLLGVTDSTQGSFGFHYGMPEMRSLYTQGALGVVANVGMLVRPTTYAQFHSPGFSLPLNLRSHSDQVLQMQTGVPSGGAGTGWGGRAVDLMEWSYSYNATTNFPRAVSIGGPATFCGGAIVQGVSLQPGNYLAQNALNLYPATAQQARAAAQTKIVATTTGMGMVDAANKVLADAVELSPLLRAASDAVTWKKPFPATKLGKQLEEIARIIHLAPTLGVGRQVFFCGLGSFDTHAGQAYQQWSLLNELSQGLDAFYAATVQSERAEQVTTFTLSDFGRTLEPSGSGCDHGWGNHHLVLGGAVKGGRIYGRFPAMTNYLNLNNTADDYADARGSMLPNLSLSQYGATLARWFGAADADLDGIFGNLGNFAARDLGFFA